MDNNNDESASTPTIGFPLATALLLLVLFGTSGLISCCYHWHRLRSLLPLLLLSHSPHPNSPAPQPPPIPLAVLPTTMHHLVNETRNLRAPLGGFGALQRVSTKCSTKRPC
ncbi:uncharacterized protein At5g65660-like isoform X4 [Malania oleifera]|uniref:uncharacterized protein At5g65660-like isoform X4 n=1 Tax=Malania oleifera TaxID=397392 RepID=UPI0025ADD3C4|nr:uncharacterized protein At5g65660-like isoform X4 [Malania oleifera]